MAQVHSNQSGPRTHYNDLKVFSQHECAETGQATPLGSIPRPPDIVTPPSILTGAQLKSVLAACGGSGFLALRDRAIVLMLVLCQALTSGRTSTLSSASIW